MSNATKETGISTAARAVTPLAAVGNQEEGVIGANIHPPNPDGQAVGQLEGLFATPNNIHPPNGNDGP